MNITEQQIRDEAERRISLRLDDSFDDDTWRSGWNQCAQWLLSQQPKPEKTAELNNRDEARKFFDADTDKTWSPSTNFSSAGRTPFVIRDDVARIMVEYASQFQSNSSLRDALGKLIFEHLHALHGYISIKELNMLLEHYPNNSSSLRDALEKLMKVGDNILENNSLYEWEEEELTEALVIAKAALNNTDQSEDRDKWISEFLDEVSLGREYGEKRLDWFHKISAKAEALKEKYFPQSNQQP